MKKLQEERKQREEQKRLEEMEYQKRKQEFSLENGDSDNFD